MFLAETVVEFSYDANGNMISRTDDAGTINYSYDTANRLIAISYPDSRPATTYAYDGNGRKTSQNIGGEVTSFLRDGEQIIEELDDTGDPRAILIHGQVVNDNYTFALTTITLPYFSWCIVLRDRGKFLPVPAPRGGQNA